MGEIPLDSRSFAVHITNTVVCYLQAQTPYSGSGHVKVAVVPDTKRKSACQEMWEQGMRNCARYVHIRLSKAPDADAGVCVCVCAPFPSFRQTGPKQICRYLAFFACSHSKLSLEKYKKINRVGTHGHTSRTVGAKSKYNKILVVQCVLSSVCEAKQNK